MSPDERQRKAQKLREHNRPECDNLATLLELGYQARLCIGGAADVQQNIEHYLSPEEVEALASLPKERHPVNLADYRDGIWYNFNK